MSDLIGERPASSRACGGSIPGSPGLQLLGHANNTAPKRAFDVKTR